MRSGGRWLKCWACWPSLACYLLGGIAGYTQAMRNYRANEAITAVSRLAIKTQEMLNLPAGYRLTYQEAFEVSENPPGIAPARMSLYLWKSSGRYYIEAAFVSKEVCLNVQGRLPEPETDSQGLKISYGGHNCNATGHLTLTVNWS